MPSVVPFRRRHDPFWDLDGRTVRRDRRLRRLLEILIALCICALLVIVFQPMNARASDAATTPGQRDHAGMQARPVAPR